MHKDIPVADIKEQNGRINTVNRIFNEEHLLGGTRTPNIQLLPKMLSNWQIMRTISNGRQDINRIERVL